MIVPMQVEMHMLYKGVWKENQGFKNLHVF